MLASLALSADTHVADVANLSGPLSFFARNGIWIAAIVMPAGFPLCGWARSHQAESVYHPALCGDRISFPGRLFSWASVC